MEFTIGEKVIYPNHGVGVIEKINSREVSGHRESFYQLKMVANSMMVMIPISNVSDVGLRKLIKKEAVNEVLDHLKSTGIRAHTDWKNRYKENSDKMRTGSIFDVADVFKSLYSLSHERVLSFREKKMLDRARYLVISELSTVWNLPELKVQEMVEHTLDEKVIRKAHA